MNELMNTPAAWADVRHLHIGELSIDLYRRRVCGPEGEVELPQRVFDLLLLFLSEPNTVHSRADLLRRVWPGVIVEDSNLSQGIWALRKALGDERKQWLRTISKKGYLFEPDRPIEVGSAAAIEPIVADEPAVEAGIAPPRRRGMSWRAVAMASCAAAVLVLLGWWHVHANAVARPEPATLTFIEADDEAAGASGRLPATLLRAWLEWKLTVRPGVLVLTQAQLAVADAQAQSSNVAVLMVSGPVPNHPANIFLEARFQDASGAHRIHVEGAPAQLAQLVDEVSRQLMRELLPSYAGQAWPDLRVDHATALAYADMVRARRARDWIKAAELGRAVSNRSPEFALGHWDLAQVLGTLGQLPGALDHLTRAKALFTPLPAQAAEVIGAQQQVFSSKPADAANAYARLAERFPNHRPFRLQQAQALARSGRVADALAILDRPQWRQPMPLPQQLAYLVARSGLQLKMGDPKQARASAEAARRLATEAGAGWDYEQGQALLALAQADAFWARRTGVSPYFEQAAMHFERAGDSFSALRTRFIGESTTGDSANSPKLDAWLAQARAAGQYQLEFSALRSAAAQLYRAGDIDGYRKRLREAQAAADASKDPLSQAALHVDWLNDEYQRADLDAAQRRLALIRKHPVQGDLLVWTDLFETLQMLDQGRYEAAAAVLERHGRPNEKTQAAQSTPDLSGVLDCPRGALALVDGRPDAARQFYLRCGATDPIGKLMAQLNAAEIDLLTGDRDAALRKLRSLRIALPDISSAPGRWGLELDLAAQLTRAGESDEAIALYSRVLPSIRRARFKRLETFALVGLAETTLAQGRFDEARRHTAAARALLDKSVWGLDYRLRLIDAMLARERGDEAAAEQTLLSIDAQAHTRNDAVVQALVHSAMRPFAKTRYCDQPRRDALVARTGLRGAVTEWMHGGRPVEGRELAAMRQR